MPRKPIAELFDLASRQRGHTHQSPLTAKLTKRSEASLPSRSDHRRHNLVFGGSPRDPNHDAVMRIGGEVLGGGPILFVGIEAMG